MMLRQPVPVYGWPTAGGEVHVLSDGTRLELRREFVGHDKDGAPLGKNGDGYSDVWRVLPLPLTRAHHDERSALAVGFLDKPPARAESVGEEDEDEQPTAREALARTYHDHSHYSSVHSPRPAA